MRHTGQSASCGIAQLGSKAWLGHDHLNDLKNGLRQICKKKWRSWLPRRYVVRGSIQSGQGTVSSPWKPAQRGWWPSRPQRPWRRRAWLQAAQRHWRGPRGSLAGSGWSCALLPGSGPVNRRIGPRQGHWGSGARQEGLWQISPTMPTAPQGGPSRATHLPPGAGRP